MTVVLDLDIGNTRTKWRCGEESGALPAPRLPTLPLRPARVRVATVLRDREALAAAVLKRFGVAAEFAAVSATLGGVLCGYCEPSRLGVDRWLAAVAAWQRARAATVVVAAGTAATIDFVHADGRHEHGRIAPGLALLREALVCRTANVRPRSARTSPARDTEAAVQAGTEAMLVACAQTAIADFARRCNGDRRCDGAPAVFLTGGDAPLLLRRLAADCRHEPHLVLDGLAIALP